MRPTVTTTIQIDPSALSLRDRAVRALRRWLRIDRERRWNKQYAEGGWEWLRNLDELAHHSVLAGYCTTLKPNGRVLDVGCGEGVFQEHLHESYAYYLGIDFAEPIRRAQPKVTTKTQFAEADMNVFTTTERFDVIVFNESAYYLQHPAEGLARYEQFLLPDGIILISMHGKARNDVVWEAIDARYVILDAVTIENGAGTRWTVKAVAVGQT